MKKELEKLQPDISNIIYRGLAKFVPDHKINLVDDVATELVKYISERLVKNNGVLDGVSVAKRKVCEGCGNKVYSAVSGYCRDCWEDGTATKQT